MSSGLSPSLSVISGSDPPARSIPAISRRPNIAARCRASIHQWTVEYPVGSL
ncbi:Ankyrin repeat domaincontaining protein 50like [Caligus rogercresseyi]|uniref:Ankyrin repeat domaincontaining protein 50like n=1 Tax=Caligus rogercresseyi TaxID=217165 RepID=A0A7T8GV60_CALRO|nr:Ankyrin repeat domaincontaining protein 50like [Caligus rogercresseyi]